MTMTIEVPIPDDLIARLDQKARSAGLDREQYIRALVSRDLAGPKTSDEIPSGFREEVAASRVSDSNLNRLF
ncbi:MAG: ribbon-helix-helix protein, CopG family [Bryobacteraceae bacterium]|nr:ribbon-helix-helix protein, CopG family [Bryobacteraceae bacterium]